MADARLSIIERIERLSIPEPNSGCWLWLGTLHEDGYGGIFIVTQDGSWKKRGAHRVSWVAHHGEIPDGLSVLHRCDHRPCVNPDHLFLGTQADNVQDMHKKRRWAATYHHGEASHLCKLTELQVREILSSPDKSTAALAAAFGVSHGTIRNIRSGRSWKNIQRQAA